MAAVVSLKDVVDALETTNEMCTNYLDLKTGEILLVTDEDQVALDETDPLPDSQPEYLEKIRKVLEAESVLRLPDSFDIHEWSFMEEFCHSVPDPTARNELLDAIHGSGAFRVFRMTLERLRLKEQWYSFRKQAFEQIGRDWLEENEIPYRE